LPEWQLEPDEEALFGDPEEYFFVDEQGNLIEPGGRSDEPGSEELPTTDRPRPGNNGGLVPVEPPPAAADDFLNRATGRPATRDPGLRPAAPVGGGPGAPANLLPEGGRRPSGAQP
ncbi:MAG: penicillin-binding protein, partial [Novosphingobium sp.]|nr:penicillin-binding protein [Novosphingobium sp.]